MILSLQMGMRLYRSDPYYIAWTIFTLNLSSSGRWNQNVTIQPNICPEEIDNNPFSAMEFDDESALCFTQICRGMFQFPGNIFGAPKKCVKTCFSLTYKQTGGVTTGEVVATFPEIIYNLRLLGRVSICYEINSGYINDE